MEKTTPVPYREILNKMRIAFPQPVSDRLHDSYFIHTVMRALDGVDALKGELPILGKKEPIDYSTAKNTRLPEESSSLEEVIPALVKYLEGSTIWGHPRTQQNVVPPPSIASLVGMLLAGLANPNLAWDEYSHKIALAEKEVVAMTSAMLGYDPAQASGVFTFGGTGTALYGMKVGIEKALPGAMENGVREDAVIFASDSSHYCRYNIAGWIGLGEKNLITIPTNLRNEMNIKLLRKAAHSALAEGRKIAGFICTMGTTDAFGLDDLEEVVKLRDELVTEFKLPYSPHVHADAVISWTWSVFNDYPFEENPLGFRPRTVRALAGACHRICHLRLADSIGVDFHKTGFTPYISSLVLFKNEKDLALLERSQERMPYLYQFGEHRPGMFTLETSRSGTGVLAALANLKLFGKQGLRAVLGHIVEMTQLLREHLEGHAFTTVLNRDNFGTVTIFRAYPDGVDTFEIKEQELTDPAFRETLLRHNEYNRRIARYVHDEAMAGRGVVISVTDCYRYTTYGEPVVGLKSYILSPFVDEENIEAVVEKVLEAREKVAI
ncbi:MAG TPA: pyridoxal-dependent decarboxylase [Thermodesulfobacteriota bacterium]|nr:pyridoxal-dependent decarboxylase [Thermodesulfobacteriota bacterium]